LKAVTLAEEGNYVFVAPVFVLDWGKAVMQIIKVEPTKDQLLDI
jgi:hypothetical protein